MVPRCRRCWRVDRREIRHRVALIVSTPVAALFLLVGFASLSPVALGLAGAICAGIGAMQYRLRRARLRDEVIVGWRSSRHYPPVCDLISGSHGLWRIHDEHPWWRGQRPY